jgi:hypothetical protein
VTSFGSVPWVEVVTGRIQATILMRYGHGASSCERARTNNSSRAGTPHPSELRISGRRRTINGRRKEGDMEVGTYIMAHAMVPVAFSPFRYHQANQVRNFDHLVSSPS